MIQNLIEALCYIGFALLMLIAIAVGIGASEGKARICKR